MKGRKRTTTGTAISIQSVKEMEVPVVSSYTAMNTTFGGVPMGVPMPPTLAAWAIPSSKGMASFGSFARSITASATGSSMSVVAVLEIHIDRTAAAAMKPNTSWRLLLPPKIFTIVSAMRRWAPLFAMAVERMKPPSSSSTRGWP